MEDGSIVLRENIREKPTDKSPLLSVKADENQAERNIPIQTRTARGKILSAAAYGIFLLWQLVALVPYVMRIFDCCFREKKVSFQCHESSVPFSAEIELAMLNSVNITVTLCLWFVRKIPHFIGYRNVVRKLLRLPSFWSLMALLVVLLIGLGVIQFSNKIFFVQTALTFTIACQGILIAALVGVLNYTQVNPIKEKYPFFVLVFFKATLVKIFIENFVFCLMGTLQLTVGVAGLKPEASFGAQIAFRVLRHFSNVVYAYKVSDFLWQKIFRDNRNILSSSYEVLETDQTDALITPEQNV